MKIDVEGFEWEVLIGAEQTLIEYKPKLLIEYSLPLYNQITPTRGEEIYNILAKIFSKTYNVELDLEICKEVNSCKDLKNLTHRTNLWYTT